MTRVDWLVCAACGTTGCAIGHYAPRIPFCPDYATAALIRRSHYLGDERRRR
ncbi:hypothetical protein [Desertihabitans brevis]|uniref:hypothetical protein n=1 Tax=Desertihabitans brevis TaxID=2268447 RepID=UPI001313FA8F|nr:hypothetical protein [Desertihabitans brevis]